MASQVNYQSLVQKYLNQGLDQNSAQSKADAEYIRASANWGQNPAFAADDLGREKQKPGYYTPISSLDQSGKLKDAYNISTSPDVAFRSNIDELKNRLGGINLNTQGLDQLRKEALMQPGEQSQWQKLALQQQGLEQGNQMNQAAKLGATNASNAFSNLARTGGASKGARERLARGAGQDIATGRQNVLNQGAQARLGIGQQAEQNRLGLLSQLPGMEIAALQPELQKTGMWSGLAESEAGRGQGLDLANRQYGTGVQQQNIQNALQQKALEEQYKLKKYEEDMKGFAANKTADATANSGGGISFICTEVDSLEPLTIGEWASLRKLRRYAFVNDRKRFDFYFDEATLILDEMKEAGFKFDKFRPFVKDVIEMVDKDQMELACDHYYNTVVDILNKNKEKKVANV